jgi:UDP-N-acetylglucosamine 2-epimerase (non-hydrolysing)
MRDIAENKDLSLQLVATGAHLEDRFGCTVSEILEDGFTPDVEVPLGLDDDSILGVTLTTGRAVSLLAEALAKLRPDIVVLLGDRYETFAAASAAMLLHLPIAHIHGGEITQGAIDESMRHAITKMAHLHFAAAEPYRNRIIRMGEDPERVFMVGALGAEAAIRAPKLTRDELAGRIGLAFDKPVLLVSYHPATLGFENSVLAAEAIVDALDAFDGCHAVFTGVNADPANGEIATRFKSYVASRPGRAAWADSLGQTAYLSLVRESAAVIGNSSSGLIEAPALAAPTINIGERQRGRLQARSVIDCPVDTVSIRKAISRALTPAFRASFAEVPPPYRGNDVSSTICRILCNVSLRELIRKVFYDFTTVT